MGTARKWIKKIFRKETDHGRDGEVEWEEDAEDDGNDEDEDDEDKNADEDFEDSGMSDKVGPKENRLRDCRCQKARLRGFIPMVYPPAKPLTMEPLPSEPPLRLPQERPQAPSQPTSRAAIEGYF